MSIDLTAVAIAYNDTYNDLQSFWHYVSYEDHLFRNFRNPDIQRQLRLALPNRANWPMIRIELDFEAGVARGLWRLSAELVEWVFGQAGLWIGGKMPLWPI